MFQKKKRFFSEKHFYAQGLTIKSTVNVPRLQFKIKIVNKHFTFEVVTDASDNFINESYWLILGRLDLQPVGESFLPAYGHDIPVLEIYTPRSVKKLEHRKLIDKGEQLQFIVTTISHLNFLGQKSIDTLKISVDSMTNKNLYNMKKRFILW